MNLGKTFEVRKKKIKEIPIRKKRGRPFGIKMVNFRKESLNNVVADLLKAVNSDSLKINNSINLDYQYPVIPINLAPLDPPKSNFDLILKTNSSPTNNI